VLEAVAAHQPDVVLLDLDLPGLDGLEVARRLRAQPALAGLKLVAVTGYGRDEDRQRTSEAGFDRHVVKPLTPDLIDELLRAFGA
jgi:CheY-like chemotaxis protein